MKEYVQEYKANLKLYTVKDLAAILEVTERTIMNYIAQGKLKGAKIGGKWKVSEEALTNYLNGN